MICALFMPSLWIKNHIIKPHTSTMNRISHCKNNNSICSFDYCLQFVLTKHFSKWSNAMNVVCCDCTCKLPQKAFFSHMKIILLRWVWCKLSSLLNIFSCSQFWRHFHLNKTLAGLVELKLNIKRYYVGMNWGHFLL